MRLLVHYLGQRVVGKKVVNFFLGTESHSHLVVEGPGAPPLSLAPRALMGACPSVMVPDFCGTTRPRLALRRFARRLDR